MAERDRKKGAITGGAIGAGVGAGSSLGADYAYGRAASGETGFRSALGEIRGPKRRAGIAAAGLGAAGAGAGALIGRKKKVKKNMSVSAFGIDHGEFSKGLRLVRSKPPGGKHAASVVAYGRNKKGKMVELSAAKNSGGKRRSF